MEDGGRGEEAPNRTTDGNTNLLDQIGFSWQGLAPSSLPVACVILLDYKGENFYRKSLRDGITK